MNTVRKESRPQSVHAYARELGIHPHLVRRLGGMERLKAMPEDARALLIGHKFTGTSKEVHQGGLRARGMRTRKAAWLIRPHVEFLDAAGRLVDDIAMLTGEQQ